MRLADLDEHPEWANAEAQEYMRRRPYSKPGISSAEPRDNSPK
jgi:hypothetical protein